jgi:hypothetical protein
MLKITDGTLGERAGYVYRRLLLLQRLFSPSDDSDDWAGTEPRAQDTAFSLSVREALEELTEHARILTTVPFPLGEWRAGDSSDDDRWRGLTEIERRSLLSMIASYEALIDWAEEVFRTGREGAATEPGGLERPQPRRATVDHQHQSYLRAERDRLGRFRKEMDFLHQRPRGAA